MEEQTQNCDLYYRKKVLQHFVQLTTEEKSKVEQQMARFLCSLKNEPVVAQSANNQKSRTGNQK